MQVARQLQRQGVGAALRRVRVDSRASAPLCVECKEPQFAAAVYHHACARRLSTAAQDDEHDSQENCSLRVGMSALLQSIQRDAAALQTLHHALAQDPKVLAVFAECAERIMRCDDDDRVVYASGIGKSGIVAQRFASTLASISVRSRWIHGSEWTHGELGNLRRGDVVILLSHSGKTSELLELPSLFHGFGCDVIAITQSATSPLGLQSDVALVAPATDNAACPVPSRSIVVQESICNALVEQLVTSMEGRATKFRQNHPGGSIGDSIW